MKRPEAECLFMLLAKSTSIVGRVYSLHDVFTDIELRRVPFQLPHPLEAVLFWRGPRGTTIEFFLRITGPSGRVAENTATVDLGATGRGIAIVVFSAPLFSDFGEYRAGVVLGAIPIYAQTVWVLPGPSARPHAS